MKNFKPFFLIILFLLVSCFFKVNESYHIRLKTRTLSIESWSHIFQKYKNEYDPLKPSTEREHVLLNVHSVKKKDLEKILQTNSSFVDRNVFVSFLNMTEIEQANHLINGAIKLEPQDKIDPIILKNKPKVFHALVSTRENSAESISVKFQHNANAENIPLYISPISPRKILIKCAHNSNNDIDLFSAVEWIAKRREVLYIDISHRNTVFNKYSRKYVQQGNRPGEPLIWKHNLRGEGQIIGCGDTGLDMSSCFFYDPQHSLPLNRVDNNHRKVVAYWTQPGVAAGDSREGHGTHVGGILAGDALYAVNTSAQNEAAQFNGLAYKSKLSYFDIGDEKQNIKIPSDLYSQYYPKFYNSGARVSSHSWGCEMGNGQNCNRYSSEALESDMFMHENNDHLIVFSAGNYGLDFDLYSVVSPSTSKNVLTVGALESPQDSWYQSCQIPSYSSNCEAYTVTGGDAVSYFSSRGYSYPSGSIKPEVIAPGFPIYSARSNGPSDVFQCNSMICLDRDGFMCPDSAAILPLRGTSMATPYVSAAAALIRQYLMNGFYPSGEQNSGNGFNPSAALVKGMIIHSGQPVSQTEIDFEYLKLKNHVDRYQGFGLIQLNTVLMFQGESNQKFQLFLTDSQELENEQTHRFCVDVSGSQVPLRFTLTWTDPAPSALARFPLVNDLDLLVYDQDGDYFPLDGKNVQTTDKSSTVERVTLWPKSSGGRYYAYIRGTYVPDSPQQYSLVATGDGIQISNSCIDDCLNSCSGNGNCTQNKICSCYSGFSGIDCSIGNTLESCETRKILITPELETFSYTLSSFPDKAIIWSTEEVTIYASQSPNPGPGSEWIASGKLLQIYGQEINDNVIYFSFTNDITISSTIGIIEYYDSPSSISPQRIISSCAPPEYSGTSIYRFYSIDIEANSNYDQMQINLSPDQTDAEGFWSQSTQQPNEDNSPSNRFNISQPFKLNNPNTGPYYFGIHSRYGGSFDFQVQLQSSCSGTNQLSSSSGIIESNTGGSFYPNNVECIWEINPSSGSHIELEFQEFNLGYGDFLEIFTEDDGAPTYRLSGSEIPSKIISPNNYLRLLFESDNSITATGFSASFQTNSGSCPNQCNGHGTCYRGVCRCDTGYYGESCLNSGCSDQCSYHGRCDGTNGCLCDYGYWGVDCQNVCSGGIYNVCSGRGSCQNDGTCQCDDPFYGPACEFQDCQSNCNENGRCLRDRGECICDSGFWGDHCQYECPTTGENFECSGRGICSSLTGECYCYQNSWGNACEFSDCAVECVNGQCNTRTAQCECDKGYWGEGCDKLCPGGSENPCNGKGDCDQNSGVCLCDELSAGIACNQSVTSLSPSDTQVPVLYSIPSQESLYFMFTFQKQENDTDEPPQRYLEIQKPTQGIEIYTKRNYAPTSNFYDDQYNINDELEEARIRFNLPPEYKTIYAVIKNPNSQSIEIYIQVTESEDSNYLGLPVNSIIIVIGAIGASTLLCGLFSVCCFFQTPTIEEEDAKEEVTVVTQFRRLQSMMMEQNRRFTLTPKRQRRKTRMREQQELREIAMRGNKEYTDSFPQPSFGQNRFGTLTQGDLQKEEKKDEEKNNPEVVVDTDEHDENSTTLKRKEHSGNEEKKSKKKRVKIKGTKTKDEINSGSEDHHHSNVVSESFPPKSNNHEISSKTRFGALEEEQGLGTPQPHPKKKKRVKRKKRKYKGEGSSSRSSSPGSSSKRGVDNK
eukprot:gb/GECH01012861.1/.p1 GENE.gb/GECH01012861.1/~~gb/GECH01012861.1/.p1  ORF type:complete len:1707 (+),score=315.99 gb/GECH01012861.1/:1-5121(+)